MFKFRKFSLKHISNLDTDLQSVLFEDIKTAKIDYCILSGAGDTMEFAPFYKTNPHIRRDEVDQYKKVAKHILATAKKMEISLVWGGSGEDENDYQLITKKVI